MNELGVEARADRLEDVTSVLIGCDLSIEAWYGVRVFTDPAPAAEDAVAGADGEWMVRAEQEAGRRDPYRQVASQIHSHDTEHTRSATRRVFTN